MGLCASTSNANIEEPKKILSSSDNNTELVKTNSQLDIGGGAQRATSLTNKPVTICLLVLRIILVFF